MFNAKCVGYSLLASCIYEVSHPLPGSSTVRSLQPCISKIFLPPFYLWKCSSDKKIQCSAHLCNSFSGGASGMSYIFRNDRAMLLVPRVSLALFLGSHQPYSQVLTGFIPRLSLVSFPDSHWPHSQAHCQALTNQQLAKNEIVHVPVCVMWLK